MFTNQALIKKSKKAIEQCYLYGPLCLFASLLKQLTYIALSNRCAKVITSAHFWMLLRCYHKVVTSQQLHHIYSLSMFMLPQFFICVSDAATISVGSLFLIIIHFFFHNRYCTFVYSRFCSVCQDEKILEPKF